MGQRSKTIELGRGQHNCIILFVEMICQSDNYVMAHSKYCMWFIKIERWCLKNWLTESRKGILRIFFVITANLIIQIGG